LFPHLVLNIAFLKKFVKGSDKGDKMGEIGDGGASFHKIRCVFYLFYCRRVARCGNDLMKDVTCDLGKALVISFVVLIIEFKV
jgi:hypothetical protein